MPKLLSIAIGMALLLFPVGKAIPQASGNGAVKHLPDVAWTRDYTIPYTSAKQSTVQAKVRQQLNLAAQFLPTLQVAFPQRQRFWGASGRYESVAKTAREFLGVPGRSWDIGASAWLDDNRYVTEEGCVPHDCVDRGMLWIDTAPGSSALIFVASNSVSFTDPGSSHIWVFVSKAAMSTALPVAFQKSARRWRDSNYAEGYKQQPLLATIVSPDGGMHDLTPEDFFGKAPVAGAGQ